MSGDFYRLYEISCRLYSRSSTFALEFVGWSDLLIAEFLQRLVKQLEDLEVPFTKDFSVAIKSTDHVVDAVFGWSSRARLLVQS